MKKLRIALSIAALVIAGGATFAVSADDSMTGYEYIPAAGGNPEQCIVQTVNCQPSGSKACTLNSHDVRDSNLVTNCGSSLRKP